MYLGVPLNLTLAFAKHVHNVKAKVASWNCLLGKLTNSTWGADPKTLRTTALALNYSSAEYASEVWARSSHAKISIQSSAMPLPYRTVGIAPPHTRREINTRTEKNRQETNVRHPTYTQKKSQIQEGHLNSSGKTVAWPGRCLPSKHLEQIRRHPKRGHST